jgi:hypothetical protein
MQLTVSQFNYNRYAMLLSVKSPIVIVTVFHFRKGVHMKTHKWFVITVLVLALIMRVTPASAARSASIQLTSPMPNPGLVGGDVIFELKIDVTDINPGVAGAEIYLGYEGSASPPVSPLGVAMALPDFFGLSDISIKEILTAAQCPGGTLPCVHLVVAGLPQQTHSGAAARFFFRCTAEGTARFTVLSSTLVDADGFQVLHTSASPVSVPCVFRATVNGKVLRQGMPAIALACSVVRLEPEPPGVGPVFTNASGNFTFDRNVPVGTYTLHARYSGYLTSSRTIIINSGTLVFDAGTTTLRGGDANDDNKINILDIGEVISEFGITDAPVGSSNPANCSSAVIADEPADINDDRNVNISDLAIAAGNWGRIGPTPWQP